MAKETIVIVPTTNCNVGCSHCMDKADMNGCEIRFEYLEKLVDRIAEEEIKADFEVTGMGEPLLYSRFLDMADLIMGKHGAKMAVVTSAYNNNESDKRERLLGFLESKYQSKAKLAVSFNMFADFEKRMYALLSDLIFSEHEIYLIVKLCVTLENAKDTRKMLAKIIVKVAEEYGLREGKICESSSEYADCPEYLKENRFKMHGKFADIRIHTKLWGLKKTGRAEMLVGHKFQTPVCDFMLGYEGNDVALHPDGYFYPCHSCICVEKRRLGHVMENSMREVLQRRDSFVRKVRKYIIPLARLIGVRPCALCKILPR